MKKILLFVPLALAALFPACGGSSGSTTPSSGTPAPQAACTQSVVLQESVSGLGSFAVVSLPFTTASAGRLDTTVDWTLPDSSIAVYLVRGECTLDQLNARTCDFVNRMEASPFPKPHVLSADNVAAGTYELIVGNAGSEDESVSAQVVLSSATCPAVAAAGASRAPESGGGPREPWLSR